MGTLLGLHPSLSLETISIFRSRHLPRLLPRPAAQKVRQAQGCKVAGFETDKIILGI